MGSSSSDGPGSSCSQTGSKVITDQDSNANVSHNYNCMVPSCSIRPSVTVEKWRY